MSRLVINRNAGASDEYGTFLPISRLIQGNVIEGMQVAAQGSPNMTVQVNPGTCLVPTGTYPTSYSYHCAIDTTGGETVTIGTASGSNPRIDYIVAYVDKSVTPSSSTPNNPNNMFKLVDVQGTPAASPLVPTVSQIQTTIGAANPYIILAQVLVGTSVTQITGANITDQRVLASTSNSNNGWQNLSGALTYAGNNGNKEFLLNTSVNLTGTLQPGYRLAATRNTTPPSQCMNFIAASSQYASIASPAGMTFTSAFTCEAWVKIPSYPPSGNGIIMGHLDNTGGNGWWFAVNPSGQLNLNYNSGGGTATSITSYVSIPLNTKVHVAGVISSVSGKLGALYINGISVPFTTTGSATALTQPTAAFGIGAWASNPSQYFNGEVFEARVWGNARTQAQVQANMAINLTGSESNLVGLWPGAGNFNDLTSNGNTLTAQNSATATQSDAFYNAVEYGIVTAVTSTQITVFTGNSNTMPNMTLNSPQYSIDKMPFGFPADIGNWKLENIYAGAVPSTGSNAKGSWYKFTGSDFSIPTGAWKFKWSGLTLLSNSAVGQSAWMAQMDSTTPTYYRDNRVFSETKVTTDANFPSWVTSPDENLSLSAQTVFSLYGNTTSSAGANSTMTFDGNPVVFRAECAYV